MSIKIINTLFLLLLLFSCSSKQEHAINNAIPERVCDCTKLEELQLRGLYLKHHQGEDTLYSGICNNKNEDGSESTWKFLKGYYIEEISRYPGGSLHEEIGYDTMGFTTKRILYYPNGNRSYAVFLAIIHMKVFMRMERSGQKPVLAKKSFFVGQAIVNFMKRHYTTVPGKRMEHLILFIIIQKQVLYHIDINL